MEVKKVWGENKKKKRSGLDILKSGFRCVHLDRILQKKEIVVLQEPDNKRSFSDLFHPLSPLATGI